MTLVTLDAEIVDTLDEKAAKQLDRNIRATVNRLNDNFDKLKTYVAQAKDGQIHVTLGYDSWTAYLSDVVKVQPASVEQRRDLVALLCSEGMSNRAIAKLTGTSEPTVRRDKREMKEDEIPSTVTGLDGKEYPPAKPDPVQDTLIEGTWLEGDDTEVVEPQEDTEVEADENKPATSLSSDFDEVVYQLKVDVHELKMTVEDKRFHRARKRIAKQHLSELIDMAEYISEVIELLETE